MGVMESALQEAARICDLYYLPLTAAETKDNWFDCVFHFDVSLSPLLPSLSSSDTDPLLLLFFSFLGGPGRFGARSGRQR